MENPHKGKTELKCYLKGKVKQDKKKKKKDLAKNQETLYYKSKDNRTLGMMTTMNQPLNKYSMTDYSRIY